MLFLLAGCDVYNQALLDGATGEAGMTGAGDTGGTLTGGGGTGGSVGGGGMLTGGTSGVGGRGGTAGSGGTEGGSGSDGKGGEGDRGSGGTGDAGQGGSAMSGAAGASATSGSAGEGGTQGGSGGAGNGGGGMPSGGAGVAGTGGAGAGSGGAGTGGAGGTAGAGEVCTGCARLSVPLATSTDQAHFTIGLPVATNLSMATISFRVARYAGTGGWFKAYIQEGSPNYLYQDSVETTISSIGTTMQTISWDVATAGTTADKTMIRRIGIEISGAGASSWTNPTVIYVDSITVTGATLAMATFTFDTSSTVSTTPTGSGPNDIIWLNNYSGDTNVTGASLSWLGP